jgi:hypothetical protein
MEHDPKQGRFAGAAFTFRRIDDRVARVLWPAPGSQRPLQGAAAGPTKGAAAGVRRHPRAPSAAVARASRRGGRARHRTLYLVDDPVFRKLPDPARDAVGTALNDVFAFAGQTRGQAPIRVIFLDPDRFPESYNFADAVVRVVDGKLTDHLDQAHQRQRDNAQHSIQALGIRVTFEPATPSQSVAERLGSSLVLKTVVPAGRTRLAIPIMVAAVDLSAVSSEFVSYYQDEARMIQGGRTLRPTDPGYWNPAQKLLDTATVQGAAKLKAAPNKPEAWDAGLQAQFGTALGRSLAHEARHLYFADADNHAATGLGASDVGDQVVADRPAYRQFSVDDRKNILAAIGKREKEQRGTTLVATFPAARRANGFPF